MTRDYYPIRRIELKVPSSSTYTLVFNTHHFGSAKYSCASYTLPTQNDTSTRYQSRKEILSFVLFEGGRFGVYQALNAFRVCDCRITFGELGYSEEVIEMFGCNLETLERTVNEEGESQIAVTVARVIDEFGEPVLATVARIGFGASNPSGNQFDIGIVRLVDGVRFWQARYENPLTTRTHRRMRGYKRTFKVEFEPFDSRVGVGEKLHRALMHETMYLRAWNVWGENTNMTTFREVVCINDEIEKEDALGALVSGRSAILEFEDVVIFNKTFPELISDTLSTLTQQDTNPTNPNTTVIATAKKPDGNNLSFCDVTLLLQRAGANEWEFWQKGVADAAGVFMSSSPAPLEYARVRAVFRYGYAQVVKEFNLIHPIAS